MKMVMVEVSLVSQGSSAGHLSHAPSPGGGMGEFAWFSLVRPSTPTPSHTPDPLRTRMQAAEKHSTA